MKRYAFRSIAVLAVLLVGCGVTLAGHGGGGHGGGGHGGGGHHGGGGFHGGGGGMHHGGFSGGGMHHGGFSGGGMQHSFSAPMHHYSAPQMHQFSAPMHHYSAPQVHNFGGTHNFGSTHNFGGAQNFSGMHHQGIVGSHNFQNAGAHHFNSSNFVHRNFAGVNTNLSGVHHNFGGVGGVTGAHHAYQHGGLHNHGNYGGYHHVSHYPNNYWRNNSYFFGIGSPFGLWGLGGYGYPYRFGYGYPGYYGYGGYGGYGYGGYGFGYGGNGGYGYGYPSYAYNPICSYSTNYYGSPALYPAVGTGIAAAVGPAVAGGVAPGVQAVVQDNGTDPSSLDFAGQGEQAFKAADYKTAVKHWRHALVDEPNNGAYVMLLGQALFAVGDFDEAAGATQQATRMIPADKWNVVVANYRELYTNIQDYTDQLRALEKARNEKPDSPALRFLLGWHYGYLGYPKHAVKELDKALELAPKDDVSKQLRDQMIAKLPAADRPAAPAGSSPPAGGDKPMNSEKPAGTETSFSGTGASAPQ